jgi:hypothetical protein
MLKPLMGKTASEIAIALWSIFSTIGFPRTLQSDNGTEFINSILTELTKLNGIDHRSLSPYHPRANGSVERTNGTVITSLKKYLNGHDAEWYYWIPFIQFCFNSKISSITGSTPFTLMFNRSPYPTVSSRDGKDQINNSDHITTSDYAYWTDQHRKLVDLIYPAVAYRISAARQKSIKQFRDNNFIIKNPYPLGAIVMLYNRTRANKLEPIYEGPYTIIHTDRNYTYKLKDNAGSIISKVPISHLKLISKVPITNPNIPDCFQIQTGDSAEIKAISHR